jgi:hypothetical protein
MFNFRTILSLLVGETPLFGRLKATNYEHENTGAGLSYSGRNSQWSFPY